MLVVSLAVEASAVVVYHSSTHRDGVRKHLSSRLASKHGFNCGDSASRKGEID
jgi:hypothetical protein